MGAWDPALFLDMLRSPAMAGSAWTTIWIATVCQTLGTLIGFVVAPMMIGRSRALRFAAFLYLWIFRGTPLLVQILFFYAVLPSMGLRLSVLTTGLLALSLNEGPRMAEVIRSGLLSVPEDQREAAASLGLRQLPTFFLVVLPQAIRAILPPLGNNYSYMIKATSLLATISVSELMRSSQQLAQATGHPLEIYSAAACWYMAMIGLATLVQAAVERRFGKAWEPRKDMRVDAGPAAPGRPAVVHPASPPTGQPVLEARGVSKCLGNTMALAPTDLVVYPGEVVVIIGPSGSGKSTLLRCLNHIETPDTGTVLLEGRPFGVSRDDRGRSVAAARDYSLQRRRVGMVFQRFNLFNHLTAEENIATGLVRVLGLSRAAAQRTADDLLRQFGLAGMGGKFPSELSGGQKQRVAIARALSMAPAVMLFDEPTSALDPEMVGEVLDAMRALAGEGMTMLVVTHEMGFARSVADRVIVMEAGHIIEQGPAASVFDGAMHERSRAFFERLAPRNAG